MNGKINYLIYEVFNFNMEQKNYFKNGKVNVWEETFAIIKSKKLYLNAFANVIDKNETTVIIEQSKYNDEDIREIEKDWKILTFDMILPFWLGNKTW